MMEHKLIKVCGMREGENIRNVDQLGVDMIGLIFYSKSPRCIFEMPSHLPERAKRVGVFVNEDKKQIQILADRFTLDYIQLHGNESPGYCKSLQHTGLKIIKNFSISTEKDLIQTKAYEGICNYFLFDTKCNEYGGSGRQFDWRVLHSYKENTPFILSGGIDAHSIKALKAFSHPQLAGYDINSRFETEPGKKDVNRIDNFVKQLKEYEQNKSAIQ